MDSLYKIKWEDLRSANTAKNIPKALAVLSHSEKEEDLGAAYWNIDNEVILQGMLFQAALPVISCVLPMLSDCKKVAKPYLLELIVQLVSGYPAPSEINISNKNIVKDIRDEATKYFSAFINMVDNGTNVEKELCIDILGILALHNRHLQEKVLAKMKQIIFSSNDKEFKEMVNNWVDEISSLSKR